MRINCPQCTTALAINTKKIFQDAVRVRCGHCKHIFRIRVKRYYQTQCQNCQIKLKIPSKQVKKNRVRLRCYSCSHVFTYEPHAETVAADLLKKLYQTHRKKCRRVLIIYKGDSHLDIVKRTQQELNNHGHETRFDYENIDKTDESILMEQGFFWLSQDLDRSLILLFMNQETVGRPDGSCLKTVLNALDRGFFILPVRLDKCMPPMLIADSPYIDLAELFPIEKNKDEFSQTLNALALILDQDDPDIGSMFETERMRLIRLLRPLPSEGMIPGYLMRFSGRDDLFKLLDKWTNDPKAEKILTLTGKPGTGKTAIASWYACFSPNAAGFHICRYGDRHMSDPRRWILSSVYQLALYIPAYKQHLSGINLENIVSYYDNRTLFDLLLVQPFTRIKYGHLPPAIFIMDGLDQATRKGENTLANLIASEWMRTPSFLKLLITTRDEPEVITPLEIHNPKMMSISNKVHDDDARNYISRYMSPYTPEEMPISEATELIFKSSEGIFLYIEWLRRELAQGRIGPYDIYDLPQGLNGMYSWLFKTQFYDFDAYSKNIRPLLDAMAAAQEPLSLEMIAHLIEWELNDRQALHNILGMLFSVTGNCFHFFHRSLGDWLRNSSLSDIYSIKEQNGHCELARLGMDSYNKDLELMPDYMLAHLPFHLCQACRWDDLENLLTDLLFIEKKCSAGMTYDLIRDFEDAICALPECQSLIENQKANTERIQKYTREIIAYARGEGKFPKTVSSKQPLSDAAIANENERIATSPTRKDKILIFYRFLFSQRHDLARFAFVPGFCLQQAYNSSKSGPVVSSAKNILKKGSSFAILEQIVSHSLSQSLQPALLRTMAGHSSWVICTAITPDGRRAISGSVDETLRVWDPEIGECLRVLEGHTDIVHDVCITPDGLFALSGSQDTTVRLWNTSTGICEKIFKNHHHGIISTSITADGNMGASADSSGRIYIWNLKTKRFKKTINSEKSIRNIEITPDGQRLYVSFTNKDLHIWNIESDNKLICLENIHVFTTFDITPTEQFVISDTKKGELSFWDITNPEKKMSFQGHESGVESISLTPDGCHAISSGRDKSIKVWDTRIGACYRDLQGHTRRIVSVCIRSDARMAVSAGLDKTLRVWDIENGKCIQSLETHSFSVNSICISQDGKTAISGSLDKMICLWDLESGICNNVLEGHSSSVESVNLSSTGQWAVTGSRDKTVRVWNIKTGNCSLTLSGHGDDVYSVCISSDGKRAVSGSRDKTLRIWDLESGKCIKTLRGHSLTVGSVKITPDKKRAVSGSRDRTLRIWDIESGKCIKTLKGHTLTVESVIVSGCGKRLISASRDRTIRVWDMKTGKCIHTLLGHTGWVRTITSTPDGKFIISGSWDCTLRVWNLDTGNCIAVFQTENGVSALSEVTRNGKFACGTKMGKVLLLKFHEQI